MSSTSTRVGGAEGVGGVEPRAGEGVRPGLGTRVLAGLDAFLSEPLRQAPAVELGRARLMVGWCLAQAMGSLLFALYLRGSGHPGSAVALVLGVGAAYGATLGLLRWASSTEPPALYLCTVVLGSFLVVTLGLEERALAMHASSMLLPVVAVFLLGPRWSFIFSVLDGLCVGLLLPWLLGTEGRQWVMSLFAAFFILCAWAVCCLLLTARDAAHEALERALRTLRDNERKLSSLLENTDDVVCSIDAQGMLIAGNPALRTMFQEMLGADLRPGQPLIPESAPDYLRQRWQERFGQVLGGQRVRFEASPSRLLPARVLDLSLNPILDEAGQVVGMTLFGRDITAHKEAEARLGEMHRSLLDVSRRAGMAEMATGILHNVGNALNSVNVSVSLLAERLQASRVVGLEKAMELLGQHEGAALGTFLAEDARGRQLPAYLRELSTQLSGERERLLGEVRTLSASVEHIKSVVSMQQEHARFSGVVEWLEVPELLDDALRLNATSFEGLGIRVERCYARVPPVRADRHKLLQILLNLLSNARHALLESERTDKCLTLRVERASERLRIAVTDNGVGIHPEAMPRLFTQGFTTKKDGHGFGLHISALAAAEMDGSLSCSSEGQGLGATFTIDLPAVGEETRA